jgi:O-antigen/teichoic acid export membrane protein
MSMSENNERIAKNTLFLYFRMMFTMLITLYTSRVVLQVLGVNDYGLYTVVGGVVSMLSFLNAALSTGSSRFLTFELGTGDFEKLRKTFSTVLNIHIIIAIVIVVLSETLGLWFVYYKLSIPLDRMNAALWVYHISVFTAIISITQVPYNASIISHEKMGVFAFASIVEVSAKLGIVSLLRCCNIDKLIFYSVLLCFIQVGMALFYRFYCTLKFQETHYEFILDRNILKSVAGFSGWSLFAASSIALNNHGTTIITNMFFGPAVVTARAISAQVNIAASQFVQNFRTAVNPQIVKKYAVEDYEGSKQLLLNSAKFSFYLMFMLGLPIILLAEPLLKLWLGQVPEYSVIFLQLIIVQSLFSVFDTSFYTALYAKGQLKENAMISPIIGFIQFPVIYLLFKMGHSPVVLSYAGIIVYAVLGLIIKPILICKIVNYTFRDIMSVFVPCMKVCFIAIPVPFLLNYFLEKIFLNFLIICLVSIICVLVVVFYIGLDRQMRYKIICIVKERLSKNK